MIAVLLSVCVSLAYPLFPGITEAVALVYSVDLKSRSLSQGTGFLIKEGILVTSLHVVLPSYLDPKNPILVLFPSSSQFGRILCADDTLDIALVKVKRKKPYLKLAPMKKLKEGDTVFALSYPGVGKLMFSEGLVEKVYGGGRVAFLLTSAPLSYGSSGGPILNSKGEVVGIATFIVAGEGHVRSMGVASDHIAELLERCKNR